MATPNRDQNLQPMVHGGRPPSGRHVPSGVPGAGAYDASAAVNQHVAAMGVGSNVVPAPGPDRDSDETLQAPPWQAMNPNAAQWMPPLN